MDGLVLARVKLDHDGVRIDDLHHLGEREKRREREGEGERDVER